jgi:hypothetical protein
MPVRGNRPRRSPVEIIVTVPLAGLHASAEAAPQHLAMTAEGEPLAAATARRLCCDAGLVFANVPNCADVDTERVAIDECL